MSNPDPMADVIEQMPQASDFADTIEAPGTSTDNFFDDEPQGETSTDSPGPSLNEGRETFDPSIHCVDANGNPKITKAGKFRRKRGKANATVAPSLNPDQINPERMANAKAAAQVSVAATFLMGQLVFGPEGQPQENEPQTMESAYTQFFYLSEKPVNIPPWALVALVVSAYSAKRMAMEQPRSRVYTGIAWIKAKVAAIWEWTMGG